MFKNKRKAVIGLAGMALLSFLESAIVEAQENYAPQAQSARKNAEKSSNQAITVTEQQAKSVKVEPALLHDFTARHEAVGFIDFNQDQLVQVFSPWQGRITQVLAKAGDDIKKGDLLFTLDSPDLIQAESNLITSAGTLQLTTQALDRARKLIETQANAQKDLEQAISDQQTAESNYKAARDAIRIFGKSDSEVDRIIASRKVDGELRITSPFSGRITARNASVGLLVQPGTAPAPFAIADLSNMWMVATVSEYDLPQIRLGQHVSVSVMAYPGRKFQGEVSNIGAAIDPATHRIAVRSTIKDPHHELRPQMLANFMILTGKPVRSVAIPPNGIVREGDGTINVFVTTDGHRFEKRPVKLGMSQDSLVQILEGVSAGEKIATDGAVFLSNSLTLQSK